MFVDYEGDKTRIYSTAGVGETFADVLARRISRRGLMKGTGVAGLTAAALSITGPRLTMPSARAASADRVGTLGFAPIGLDEGPDPVIGVILSSRMRQHSIP